MVSMDEKSGVRCDGVGKREFCVECGCRKMRVLVHG